MAFVGANSTPNVGACLRRGKGICRVRTLAGVARTARSGVKLQMARETEKDVIFYDEARLALVQGVYAVAAAVKVTLGPKGRNVVLQRQGDQLPQIVNDGVTIAREVVLHNHLQNVGATLVVEVASKTDLNAGDGTTTSTVLCEVLVREGMKYVQAGRSPVGIKVGIERAVKLVQDEVRKYAKQISSYDDLLAVAMISAGNNPEIGEMVAKAFDRIGKNGSTTVEEGKGLVDEVFFTDGMEINQGYLSEYFADKRGLVDMRDCRVLLTDSKIENVEELVDLLEDVATEEVPLLIICGDISDEALTSLVLNRQKGILDVCAIKAPGVGNRRADYLRDIGAMTGAKLYSTEAGQSLDAISMSDLGNLERALMAAKASKLVAPSQTQDAVNKRVESLQRLAEEASDPSEREYIRERIAKLAGGIARFRLGGNTEVEVRDKALRYEDAINATRAALMDGIVAGGGVALVQARKILPDIIRTWDDEDVRFGGEIVYKALFTPCMQIAYNAGQDGDVIAETVELECERGHGFNAKTLEYADMMATGVVDPCRVTCAALGAAASVAALILTTDCLVVEIPKPPTAEELAAMAGAGEYVYGDEFGG
ncbi:60 kDa chaperonin 2 [Porphyridium purpureum]|uniref:60 kDa chaperonin 2 n=1 Tax=Porphyridium purpureum TaxID=35688 RepID=A0A5J4Z108_PORPP|nr:60 kDa chaperonin 2 [Porphyridium purpureum]|eukprot:POR3594..scf208_2